MKILNVRRAQEIAREVVELADKAIDAEERRDEATNQALMDGGYAPLDDTPTYLHGSMESGALRRRSLDLTRALAEMRRP